MKHLFLFAAIGLLAIGSTAHAQQMMLGARFGLNLTNQHYDNPPNAVTISGRTLGLAGAQLDYDFSKTWALSIQVLYDQKGVHADNCYFTTDESPSIDYGAEDWTTNYLEIPLEGKVSFSNSAFRPYLFAGPSIGFLLSSSVRLRATGGNVIPNGYGTTYPVDTTMSSTDYTNKTDVSIIAGAGISWEIANGATLLLDAAYAQGLTNINQASGSNIYSRDIRLAAGVLFPIK